MRKGETLEQEAARKKIAQELPGKVVACTKRVENLCDTVRHMTATLQNSRKHNTGGEKSGTL